MKFHLISICLLCSCIAIAQPSKEQIIKHKIKKITRTHGSDENVNAEIIWYDRKGNDSLAVTGDVKAIFKHEYKNGKLMSTVIVDQGGTERERVEYTYSPDGSYKKTRIEENMQSHEWFNVKDKKVKSQSPDGNTLTYKYDTKGKLTSITSDAANNGIKVKRTYLYDVKGNLVKEDIDINGSKAATTYFYNAKNQVTREIGKGQSFGNSFLNTTDYTYNSKGLVSKKVVTRREGDLDPMISSESITYEHY